MKQTVQIDSSTFNNKYSEWLIEKNNFTSSCKYTKTGIAEILYFDSLKHKITEVYTNNMLINVKNIVGFDSKYKNYTTWYDYFENENRFAPSDIIKVLNIPFIEPIFAYKNKYYIKDGMHRISFLKFYAEKYNLDIELEIEDVYFYEDKPSASKKSILELLGF